MPEDFVDSLYDGNTINPEGSHVYRILKGSKGGGKKDSFPVRIAWNHNSSQSDEYSENRILNHWVEKIRGEISSPV